MFNMLGPYFDGGQALDLYAGTGALGMKQSRVVWLTRR